MPNRSNAPSDGGTVTADRPADEEQNKTTEEEGRLPTFLEGQRLTVVAGKYAGRMVYVVDHLFDEVDDYIRFHSAHPYRNTTPVAGYVVKTRDSRNEQFEVKPEEVRALDTIEGWGRGSAPEVIEGDPKDATEKRQQQETEQKEKIEAEQRDAQAAQTQKEKEEAEATAQAEGK